jgi:predicted regulator of Ras-like GTPase activity (Roadblock/LC7/MglB family)
MLVEHWATGGGPSAEVLAAELTPVVRSIESLSRHAGGGGLRDLLVRLSSWSILVQPVNADIFLVLVARHEAIPGRLRFEAARAAQRLETALR